MILFVSVLVLAAPTSVPAATELGVRGGWANATGDVFAGSGNVGSSGIYGLVVSIGLFSSVDLEFAYERYTSDFSFKDALTDGQKAFNGDAEYEDQAYILTGKLNLPLLAAPFGLYVGGGFSLHELDLKVDSDESDDSEIEEYLKQIGGDRSEWDWHAVGGLGWKLPALPLRAYAEYRYQNIQDDESPSYSSVYAGLNLYME